MLRCHRVEDDRLGARVPGSSSCGPRGGPCRVGCCSCFCCCGHVRCRSSSSSRSRSKGGCGRWSSSCGAPCTKALLVIVNFVFLVCGLVFVCVGLMLYIDKESRIYVDLLHRMPSTGPLVVLEKLPSVFIGIGAAVVVLSFLGCYGACEESVCFLCMYALLLFLILGTEIITGSMLTVFRDKISLNLQSLMQYQLTYEYNRTALPSNITDPAIYHVTFSWDTMQVKLNCCGAVGPLDYKYSAWFNHSKYQEGMFVPVSCCVLLNDDTKNLRAHDEDRCQIDAILEKKHSTALKTQGCRDTAVKWLEANMSSVVVIAANVIAVQVMHFLFACSLLSRLKRSHSEYQWYEDNDGGWQGA